MSGAVGDVILVLRRAMNITQEDLAARLGITQAALSRYENGMRTPDSEMLEAISSELGVTSAFLGHNFRMKGAIAADAHMRRQKTARPGDWKRVEAMLNVLRMHTSYLMNRVPIRPQNQVIQVDPDETSPAEAAGLLRAAWKLPIGPVRGLVRWIESAGVFVIEEDFGTHRIDGMSQWAGEHAVIVLNAGLPTDRKRLTLAHELGHLVLHNEIVDEGVEQQANEFAAEFLMPAHVIGPTLGNLTLGKLADLKREWGVSMQAIFERAYRMGRVSADERTAFYKQLAKRGWRAREPISEELAPELPEFATSVGQTLDKSGLRRDEVLQLVGVRDGSPTPFVPQKRILRAV